MQNVSFVLPTVDAAGMTKNDQGALIVNQATAIIVAAYLEHANTMGFTIGPTGTVGTTQLKILIQEVQDELKNF